MPTLGSAARSRRSKALPEPAATGQASDLRQPEERDSRFGHRLENLSVSQHASRPEAAGADPTAAALRAQIKRPSPPPHSPQPAGKPVIQAMFKRETGKEEEAYPQAEEGSAASAPAPTTVVGEDATTTTAADAPRSPVRLTFSLSLSSRKKLSLPEGWDAEEPTPAPLPSTAAPSFSAGSSSYSSSLQIQVPSPQQRPARWQQNDPDSPARDSDHEYERVYHGGPSSYVPSAPLTIDLNRGRPSLDFNPPGQKGFYTTHKQNAAKVWAQDQAEKKKGSLPIPVVHRYRVKEDRSRRSAIRRLRAQPK